MPVIRYLRKWAVHILLILASCGDDAATEVEISSWAKISPEQIMEAEKHCVPVAFENEIGMRFVLIPAGTFMMGSPEDEERRFTNESQHEVTVAKPFYMQISETTNGQFRAFRPDHSSGHVRRDKSLDGDSQPVVMISPRDAVEFAEWVALRDCGRVYRLPTEEEWERAGRAGSESKYYWGDLDEEAYLYANGRDPKAGSLHPPGWTVSKFPVNDEFAVSAPVGSFLPNGYGLYDMLGNVHECCKTAVGSGVEAGYFFRGGGFGCGPQRCRLAVRLEWISDLPGVGDCGFRLVSPVSEKAE